MDGLTVVQVGDPVLRRRAAEVPIGEIASDSVSQLIERMWDTLHAVPGVGLAAPQIGESVRVVVVHDLPEFLEQFPPRLLAEREREPIDPYVLINPVLTPMGHETRTFFEGCLSVEGYTAAVERAHEVEAHFVDPAGEERHQRVRGWHARILQHELDHLDGALYVDRMDTRTLCSIDLFPAYSAIPVEQAVRMLADPSGA